MIKTFQGSAKVIFKTTVDKVWKGMTDRAIVKQYFYGSTLETDWKKGSAITFSGVYEGKPYKDIGKILEYIPNKRLEFSYLSSWSGKEDKEENYLFVQYEVREVPGGTELTVTQSNYDETLMEHSRQGWLNALEGLRKLLEEA